MLIAKIKDKKVKYSLQSVIDKPIAEAFGITTSNVSFKSLFIGPR